MDVIVIKSIAAVLIAAVAMFIAIRMVRFAATLCVTLLGLGAVGFALYKVALQEWEDWPTLVLGSLLTGAAAALLSLPALPFTHYVKRK